MKQRVTSAEARQTSSEVFLIQKHLKFSSNEEEGLLDLTMNSSTPETVKFRIIINDDTGTEIINSTMKVVGHHRCLMYFMVPGQLSSVLHLVSLVR